MRSTRKLHGPRHRAAGRRDLRGCRPPNGHQAPAPVAAADAFADLTSARIGWPCTAAGGVLLGRAPLETRRGGER